MTIYCISPRTTIGKNTSADKFFKKTKEEIEKYFPVQVVSSESDLDLTYLKKGDSLIFFNRSDQNYSNQFNRFMDRIREQRENGEVHLFPVAISERHRHVWSSLSDVSFDFVEHVESRDLPPEGSEGILASIFIRTIVSESSPTLYKDRLKFFISYRRKDGEAFARKLGQSLVSGADGVFRDLTMRTGTDSLAEIRDKIQQSDVVLLLDTKCSGDKKPGEIDWISQEVQMAIRFGIPIIWLRIGDEQGRKELNTKPKDKYDICLDTDKKIEDFLKTGSETIHKNCFYCLKNQAGKVMQNMRRIEIMADKHEMSRRVIDEKYMIQSIVVEGLLEFYTKGTISHLLQFYTDSPDREDVENKHISVLKRNNHNKKYSSTLILSSNPPNPSVAGVFPEITFDTVENYANKLEDLLSTRFDSLKSKNGAIIISGSFTNATMEEQLLHDALKSFSEAILKRGRKIIFGSHPTFQSIILEEGEKHKGNSKETIHMYISKHFVSDQEIENFRKFASVYPTENICENRAKSLSLMRGKMISDPEASALICIGGKSGTDSGVDEEIELAKARGLPVFLIGSVGGRTAEKAAKYRLDNWEHKMNEMSPEENDELMDRLEYHILADKILDHLDKDNKTRRNADEVKL